MWSSLRILSLLEMRSSTGIVFRGLEKCIGAHTICPSARRNRRVSFLTLPRLKLPFPLSTRRSMRKHQSLPGEKRVYFLSLLGTGVADSQQTTPRRCKQAQLWDAEDGDVTIFRFSATEMRDKLPSSGAPLKAYLLILIVSFSPIPLSPLCWPRFNYPLCM